MSPRQFAGLYILIWFCLGVYIRECLKLGQKDSGFLVFVDTDRTVCLRGWFIYINMVVS